MQAPTQDAAAQQDELAPPEHVIVKCAGLTKIFRDFWMRSRVKAVAGIDLEVNRGEVFGLLGPNGSGKSTTIKMILGLLHPTSGRIAVFGKHPREVSIKEEIGYLPEESYLYRFLNARETLEYYARLFHQNRRQRKQRIDMLLEMVGLDKVAHRPVGEYSKGMQRRIGLAQALINDPQLLILDEPTTGLDPLGTRQIKDLIQELADRGKTVLLCSHLLADVEDVCDRVSIMYGGKVRQQGTVDQLLVKSGLTDIQAANLTPEDIQAIEQLLESRGKHIERVDQPRQRLEQLFLDIVHAAQSEGVDTSGAASGGRIAEFLSAGGREQAADPERVIESLVQPEPQAPEEAPVAEPMRAEEGDHPEASERAGDAVLDQLVSGEGPTAGSGGEETSAGDEQTDKAAPAAPSSQQADESEQVDDAVLDSLLGGDEPQDTRDDSQRDKPA
ncbi:MAG: ATP-binding cassette domain-containing protein [Phycisphaeraceae bacterium]